MHRNEVGQIYISWHHLCRDEDGRSIFDARVMDRGRWSSSSMGIKRHRSRHDSITAIMIDDSQDHNSQQPDHHHLTYNTPSTTMKFTIVLTALVAVAVAAPASNAVRDVDAADNVDAPELCIHIRGRSPTEDYYF